MSKNEPRLNPCVRLAIVAPNASKRMGGEASLPLFYFQLLRERGAEVHLVCHARTQAELLEEVGLDAKFLHFIPDSELDKNIFKLGKILPHRLQELVFGQVLNFSFQYRAKALIRSKLIPAGIQGIFQPSPISPRGLSLMYKLGIPVVIGPLCGGLDFPPAFQYMDSKFTRISIHFSRILSGLFSRVFRGQIEAKAVIVANQRTAGALHSGIQGKIYEVNESGFDLKLWSKENYTPRTRPSTLPIQFAFSGRFVDWKGIEFLIEAFYRLKSKQEATLHLIGNGELLPTLKQKVIGLGISDRVHFHGFLSREEIALLLQDSDVYVMPSLRECGGTAILEAMSLGLPVIVANWAGPAFYVNDECGIRVEPSSREDFVRGLESAMLKLGSDPALRNRMGEAGKKRVRTDYLDWDSKADRILEILIENLRPVN